MIARRHGVSDTADRDNDNDNNVNHGDGDGENGEFYNGYATAQTPSLCVVARRQ